ncbi:hypothetical protein [Halalkalibacterium ligniniphilum]|uniref:hypothetical protein n=1 Tax=Halalkalibacterium ligniniphilum TaxID=1134413 RepID=UPI000346847D|nr:hypothetical protein [Halalkalibacterium ligniniphilum]
MHLIYGYILYLFHTSKGKKELEKAIKKALDRNPHVPARLKQIQLVPSLPHASYQIASPEEAESYVFIKRGQSKNATDHAARSKKGQSKNALTPNL